MSIAADQGLGLPAGRGGWTVHRAVAGKILLWVLTLRWLAGIAENFGLPGLSEFTAIIVLVTLAGMFLLQMRMSADGALLIAGVLAWMFTGVLSLVANDLSSRSEAVALLALLGLYALFANAALIHFRDPVLLPAIQRFLAAFIAIGAGLSVFQVINGSGFVEPGGQELIRAYGSDVHPVSFAIQVLTAVVGLEIIRVKRRLPMRRWHLTLVALAGLAIYLTYARTAWVMGFLIVVYLMMIRGSWVRRGAFLVAVAIGLAIILPGSDRFADLSSLPFFLSNFAFSDLAFDYRYVDNSVSWRIVNWSYGYQQAMLQPVLGYGPGQSASASYFNLEMHNILLEMLFEGGILGLGAFIVALAGLARLHKRLPKASGADRYARQLANGLGFSLLLAVIFSTSFVDQLMSVLIYLVMLSLAAIKTDAIKPPPQRGLQ